MNDNPHEESGMEPTTRTKWFKIARCDTKGKILDVTDPNPRPRLYDPEADKYSPKIVVNYCAYNEENGVFKARVQHRHSVDLDALALLSVDMMMLRKGEKSEKGYVPILVEFKGGSDKQYPEVPIVSRSLTVAYMDTLNGEPLRSGPVYQFTFVACEGEEGSKGQVMPKKGGKPLLKEMINIGVGNARKLGCTLDRYLKAKETAALLRADFSG